MPSTQQPPQDMLTSTPTRCITIKGLNKNNHLPSSAIKRNELVNVTAIVQKYQNYCHPSRIATLARKVAEKCYFGPTVLKQCTVSGYRGWTCSPHKGIKWFESPNLYFAATILGQSCGVWEHLGNLHHLHWEAL